MRNSSIANFSVLSSLHSVKHLLFRSTIIFNSCLIWHTGYVVVVVSFVIQFLMLGFLHAFTIHFVHLMR